MSENELKSCPFCGGKAEIFYWQGYINDECHSNLTCTTCGGGDKEAIKIDIYSQVMLNWDKFVEYVWDCKGSDN